MVKSTLVFVDTSAFKAVIDGKDKFHQKAIKVWQRLKEEKVTLATSNYVLDETFTLLRARLGFKTADTFRQSLIQSTQAVKIIRVSVADEAQAWQWFGKDWTKLSFTDCVSFALMRRLGIARVGSFDEHFRRAGLRIEE